MCGQHIGSTGSFLSFVELELPTIPWSTWVHPRFFTGVHVAQSFSKFSV